MINQVPILFVKSILAEETYGSINKYYSLIWTLGFNDIGDFELIVPCTKSNYELLQIDRIIVKNDGIVTSSDVINKNSMIITSVQITTSDNKKKLIVRGKQYIYVLHRRAIFRLTTIYGSHEHIIETLIKNSCVKSFTDVFRAIYDDVEFNHMLPAYSSSFSKTGGQVDDAIIDYAQRHKIGVNIYPSIYEENKIITVDVEQGINRTIRQAENQPVIFSPDFNTVTSIEYEKNGENYANHAVVAGEGEGKNRVIESFDYSYEDKKDGFGYLFMNEYLNEIYIDARDLQRDEGESDAAYRARLKLRGEEKIINDYSIKEGFSCDATQKYKYGVDYFLGDIVTVKDYFIEMSAVVSMVTFSYDENGYKCIPILANYERVD